MAKKKRKKKSKAAVYFEYLLLRTLCAVINACPYAVVCMLARIAARFAFSVLRINRKRTIERISGVFPDKSRKEVKRIALMSMQNIFLTAVEMQRAPRLDEKWIERHVKDVHVYAQRLKELVDEGKGVVIMVPHSGNWYMAAWAMASCGVPLFAIAARQRNPYVYAWMQRQYGERLEVLERGSAGTMREILSRLRKGKAFAILPDLRVAYRDTEVPFLNGTANVSHGGALFAVSAGCPIVVALMRRVDGKHEFDHLATLRPNPDAPDRKEEARRLTREVMSLLDGAIQKTPEHWFWYNKRWILEPAKR